MLFVFRNGVRSPPTGSATEFQVIMDHMSVVHHVKLGLADDLTLIIKDRPMKGDVISLPFPRPTRRIDEWLGPAVQSSALSVRISDVLEGIKNLYLILPHQKDPAVSATLTASLGHLGSCKFNVQPAGTKLLLTDQIASATNGLKGAFDQFPFGGAPIPRLPIPQGFLGTVKQDDRTLGRFGRLRVVRFRFDHWGLRLLLGVRLMHLDSIDEHVFDLAAVLLSDFLLDDGV